MTAKKLGKFFKNTILLISTIQLSTSLTFSQTLDTLLYDKQKASDQALDAFFHSEEYLSLVDRLEELEVKYLTEKDKKNTVKTIGYTSGTLGLISSIWAMYEKNLSLQNSKVELVIRNGIRDKILKEIEEYSVTNKELLPKKFENLAEVEEKIKNINMRIRISTMGLYRGIFKGVTSIGLFVLTIFIDEFSTYINNLTKSKQQQYKEFLTKRKNVVIEMGLDSLIKHEDRDISALSYWEHDKEWNNALLWFKVNCPQDYNDFKHEAINSMVDILRQIAVHQEKIIIDFTLDRCYTGYMVCNPDGTKTKVLNPRTLQEIKGLR